VEVEYDVPVILRGGHLCRPAVRPGRGCDHLHALILEASEEARLRGTPAASSTGPS